MKGTEASLLDLARDLLKNHWGLSAEMRRLPGENHNYLAEPESGDPVVLKILSEPHADPELEHAVITMLHEEGVPVPLVIPSTAGLEIVPVEEMTATARVQEYLPGTPWKSMQSTTSRLKSIGGFMGNLHTHLMKIDHPGAARTHEWDLAHADIHREKVRYLANPDQRRIIEYCFHLHSALACPRLASCPSGLLHGDINDENLLLEHDRVVGLLDFGDCLEGALVQDLGIALAYALEQEDVSLEAAASLIEGYDERRPLDLAEQEVLLPLAMARLATYVAVNADRMAADPGDSMRNLHLDTAWSAIDMCMAMSPSEARDVLCSGCSTHGAIRDRTDSIRSSREKHIGPSLSLNYEEPLHIITGRGQYLHAANGRPFLDLVNNVCHVGHCHPRVADAIARQSARLNTNTRYLHEHLADYAERLCETMPDELDTCFMVNSGTEANELALRLARAATGAKDVLVLDGAYHGHTGNCIAMSPYKFNGPGGDGPPEWVHVLPMPDTYRGPYRDADAGSAYAIEVADIIGKACSSGRSIAGFFAEPMLSCGGQVPLPHGYLSTAFDHVRNAGGICIADEVQVGFGRLGEVFWGFELHDVVPDIVVLGKPIGNGHPMGAVVTTRAIAEAFNNGMEFFSTFGGNPVSCACGIAVLDVILDEGLQDRARVLGLRFMEGLKELQECHQLIGDVRGRGLFLGIELVRDRKSLEPADSEASRIVNQMRDRGVLLSTDGPLHNVIKIKPPMVLDEGDIDMTLRLLDDALGES
ncbi:MAG: aminotransferase class III-fold pyridoxal phosphate-dependent enzyme [Planctomycetota bacterium]|nr:aminotransferase class III-fold pyridoxal phosphate-dependent enzyme [Planctomycetota bacterium]